MQDQRDSKTNQVRARIVREVVNDKLVVVFFYQCIFTRMIFSLNFPFRRTQPAQLFAEEYLDEDRQLDCTKSIQYNVEKNLKNIMTL